MGCRKLKPEDWTLHRQSGLLVPRARPLWRPAFIPSIWPKRIYEPARAAIAIVGTPTAKARTTVADGTTTTVTRLGVAAGSLLVVPMAAFYDSDFGSIVLTDDKGGSWATANQHLGDAKSYIHILYSMNAAGGDTIITINPTGASGSDVILQCEVCEFSGALTAAALDVIVDNQATSAAPLVASGTLAQADEVIVAIGSHTAADTTWAADGAGGYVQIGENESNSGGQTYNSQYKIVAATTSDQADWALGASRAWFACLASFKGAAVGGQPAPYRRRGQAIKRSAYY